MEFHFGTLDVVYLLGGKELLVFPQVLQVELVGGDACLNGMRITLEGYYVDESIFAVSEEQLSDGRAMMLASCGEDYVNKVTVRWNSGGEPLDSEEIVSGFNR